MIASKRYANSRWILCRKNTIIHIFLGIYLETIVSLSITYGTAQLKLDKVRVWHVLYTTCFSFRMRAGIRALARSMM